MKTETEIAKENVRDYQRVKKEDLEISPLHYLGLCNFHKATCQRFLEFLEEHKYRDDDWNEKAIQNKITDLKNTIKLYEDAGI